MDGSPLIQTDTGRVIQPLNPIVELSLAKQLAEPPPPVIRKATPEGKIPILFLPTILSNSTILSRKL